MTTSDYQGTPDGLTEAWRDRIDIGQPTAFPAMVDAELFSGRRAAR